jgi:peptide/nickel transport system permease protein
MKWYIVRRLAWTVVATFIILSLTFGLMAASPDPQAASYVAEQVQTGGDYEQAQESYEKARGLDRPLWERYTSYMVGMATFDWGWSETRSQPVTQAIAEAWPYSVMYGTPALIISTVLGVAIGLYSATHRNSMEDYAASAFAFFGISIPDFWFAILMILVFGVWLGWIPIYYHSDVPWFSLQNAQQLVAPTLVVTLSSIASEMRFSRATALEYVNAEFVKTAKAKGANSWRRVTRHIFRPALVPLSTILVGDILNIVLVSSYLVEVVFGIPGLGQLSYKAILQQDVALVLATVLIPTFIAIVGNLFQDLAYTVLDPRIDYGDR